jgi:Tol biopolymer transport system component
MNRKLLNGLLIVCTAISLILTSCKTKVPTEPETINYHNKILFTSSRSGKPQLYMINPDGTGIRQITSGEYYHYSGRWSPDATRIVCNTEENTTTSGDHMVVMNVDGSNRKLLPEGSQMCWSPDGNSLLINYPNVTIVDYPNFSSIKRIGPDSSGYATWAPDGNEIAFGHSDITDIINGTAISKIFLMDKSGLNIRKITNQNSRQHYAFPRWSPDGTKLLFNAINIDGPEQYLYMVNKDGTNLYKVIDDNSVTSFDWSK